MERKQETKIVKKALEEAGYDVTVSHGTGTSWDWLLISVFVKCQDSRVRRFEISMDIKNIAQKVTGRSGDYDGNINVCVDTN